jgi:hypothetical protein
MGRISSNFRNWWSRFTGICLAPYRRNRWRVLGYVGAGDLLPETIRPAGAYVVGTPQVPRWLAFECACGTGHRVMLNLDPSRSPRWVLASTAPLTVIPSVDSRRPEQRCHYVIRGGRVQWVPNRKWDDDDEH